MEKLTGDGLSLDLCNNRRNIHVSGRGAKVKIVRNSGDLFIDADSGVVNVMQNDGTICYSGLGGIVRVPRNNGSVCYYGDVGHVRVTTNGGEIMYSGDSGRVIVSKDKGSVNYFGSNGDVVKKNRRHAEEADDSDDDFLDASKDKNKWKGKWEMVTLEVKSGCPSAGKNGKEEFQLKWKESGNHHVYGSERSRRHRIRTKKEDLRRPGAVDKKHRYVCSKEFRRRSTGPFWKGAPSRRGVPKEGKTSWICSRWLSYSKISATCNNGQFPGISVRLCKNVATLNADTWEERQVNVLRDFPEVNWKRYPGTVPKYLEVETAIPAAPNGKCHEIPTGRKDERSDTQQTFAGHNDVSHSEDRGKASE